MNRIYEYLLGRLFRSQTVLRAAYDLRLVPCSGKCGKILSLETYAVECVCEKRLCDQCLCDCFEPEHGLGLV